MQWKGTECVRISYDLCENQRRWTDGMRLAYTTPDGTERQHACNLSWLCSSWHTRAQEHSYQLLTLCDVEFSLLEQLKYKFGGLYPGDIWDLTKGMSEIYEQRKPATLVVHFSFPALWHVKMLLTPTNAQFYVFFTLFSSYMLQHWRHLQGAYSKIPWKHISINNWNKKRGLLSSH